MNFLLFSFFLNAPDMHIFTQSKFFDRKSVQFQERGILVSNKTLLNSDELNIPYEDIHFEQTRIQKTTNKFYLIITLLSGSLLVKSLFNYLDKGDLLFKGLWPVSLIFFIVFLISTLLSRKELYYISTFSGGTLAIFNNNPSRIEFEEFKKQLEARTKSYLKKEYAKVDKDLSIENQIQNLNYLKQRKIISESEYLELRNKLTGNSPEIQGFKTAGNDNTEFSK